MFEFPSRFPTWDAAAKPRGYLSFLTRAQWRVLLIAAGFAIAYSAAAALLPQALGNALDAALAHGFGAEVGFYALVLLALGIVVAATSAGGHLADVYAWMRASLTSSRIVGHHVTRSGHALTKDLATGEIISTVASDAFHLGNLLEHVPTVIGGVFAYLLVSALMLAQSLPLGLFVLLGLPVVTGLTALLVKPIQTRQNEQREAQGKLTTLGSDTVAGLRILRGIGGEDVFAARYRAQSQKVRANAVRVADLQAILMALRTLLPSLFIVGVVWFGARLAIAGDITVGQLVAFYGYTGYLAEPMRQVTFLFTLLTRARVAVDKTTKVLAVRPAAGGLGDADEAPAGLRPLATTEPILTDADSQLAVAADRFTVLVAEDPDASAAIARRLARMSDADAAGVCLAGRPITSYPLAEVRHRVVLAEATPQLFSGTLRSQVDAREDAAEQDVWAALAVADAHDVTQTLGGLQGKITEKGRSLSGGQRQRVALARAVLTEAEVAILIEPTSAVDAHTEARIAGHLAKARAGRSTLVVSASPLVLEHADDVVFVTPTGVVARGTHRDLLDRARAGDPGARAYRAVVARTTAEEEDADAAADR